MLGSHCRFWSPERPRTPRVEIRVVRRTLPNFSRTSPELFMNFPNFTRIYTFCVLKTTRSPRIPSERTQTLPEPPELYSSSLKLYPERARVYSNAPELGRTYPNWPERTRIGPRTDYFVNNLNIMYSVNKSWCNSITIRTTCKLLCMFTMLIMFHTYCMACAGHTYRR